MKKEDKRKRRSTRTCDSDGCDQKHYARGMCRKHYGEWHSNGGTGIRCAVVGCDKSVDARGLCKAHSLRMRKHGSLLEHLPATYEYRTRASKDSALRRFFTSLDWRNISDPTSCWESTAGGGGRYSLIHDASKGGNNVRHRWAYERWVGSAPDGWPIDHLCGNSKCVNPSHLEPVPPFVNFMRGYADAIRKDYGEEMLARELEFIAKSPRSNRQRSNIWSHANASEF